MQIDLLAKVSNKFILNVDFAPTLLDFASQFKEQFVENGVFNQWETVTSSFPGKNASRTTSSP